MKTFIIVVGIVVIVLFVAFLWMLVAGTDESRKHGRRDDDSKE